MKLLNLLKVTLLFCLFFSMHSQAQTYIPPSQERVTTLLEQIEDCKNNIKQAELDIKGLEKNSEWVTLADYIKTKQVLELLKKCVDANRKELESLRKDYPGWFNSPNATMSLDRDRDITPRELENKVATIEERIAALMESFGNLEEPEN